MKRAVVDSRTEAVALSSVDLVATGIRARAAMADMEIGWTSIGGRVQAITLRRILAEHALHPADVPLMLAIIASAYDTEMGAEWKRCFEPWMPARPRRSWRWWIDAGSWALWSALVLTLWSLAVASFLR